MTKAKNARFKLVAMLLCALFLVSALVPVLSAISAGAANNITIYFDTSSTGADGGSYGWSKTMSNVYYYAFKSSNTATHTSSKPLAAMIPMGEDGSDGGKLFKVTIDLSTYDTIIFSSIDQFTSTTSGNDVIKRWQTTDYTLSSANNGHIFKLNNSGTNDQYDTFDPYSKKQVAYDTKKTYTAQTDTDKWALANYSDTAKTFKLVYSNSNSDTVTETYTLSAYTLDFPVEVPIHDPIYTTVKIYMDSETTPVKTYTLGTEKIPGPQPEGHVFIYGVSKYAQDKIFYGNTDYEYDKRTLCFWSERIASTTAQSGKLYLSSTSFPSDAYSAGNFTLRTKNGSTYSFEAVTSNGNASFVTTSAVSAAADDVLTLEVTKNSSTDIFHMLWESSTNNLIEKPNDVALVSGKYSAASVISNGITINSAFYDYLYDDGNGNPNESSKGDLRRPYKVINEKISNSSYASSVSVGSDYFKKTLGDDNIKNKVPMYLGGFWNANNKYYDQNCYDQTAGNYTFDAPNDNGETGNKLTWFRYGANLAYRPENQSSGDYDIYSTVAQGLVDNALSGNVESGYVLKANGENVPYFDPNWWTTNGISNYFWGADNIAFPFFTVEASSENLVNGSNTMLTNSSKTYQGTYYRFDSKKDVVHVSKNNAKVDSYTHNAANDQFVYDGYGNGWEKGTFKGFFPYNSGNYNSDIGTYNDPRGCTSNNSDQQGNKQTQRQNLNYGFGVRFDFDFYLTENGTLDDTENGIPITFTFQGDDDVWVFLDDQLILDMGGDHKNALGEINFAEKKIYISQAGYANTNLIEKNTTASGSDKVDGQNVNNKNPVTWTVDKLFSEANNAISDSSSYVKSGKHRLTMYYLERGMFNSNLFVMFNLPQDTTIWDLQEDTDYSAVNAGFKKATKIVADNDVFNYTIENKGTSNSGMSSNYKNPTYENITRNNTEESHTDTTVLADDTGQGTSPVYSFDENNIYIKVFSGFTDSNNVPGVYCWNDTINKSQYIPTTIVTEGGQTYYKAPFDRSNYTNLIIVRHPSISFTDVKTYNTSNGWSQMESAVGGTINNQTDNLTIQSGKNVYEATGWGGGNRFIGDWKSTRAIEAISGYEGNGLPNHTNDFAPANTTEFQPLQKDANNGVTYKLYDPFVTDHKPATFDTRKYNNTGNSNVVSLQYGQMATFRKQFTMDSEMRVTQLDTLSSAPANLKTGSYDDTSQRLVSSYYDVYVKSRDDLTRPKYAGLYDGDDLINIPIDHVETMYNGKQNWGNNPVNNLQSSVSGDVITTYKFRDPSDSSNRFTQLRQVFVNAVRTADLTITKEIAFGETSNQTFNLNIKFTNVFGSTLGDSEIGTITFKHYTVGGTETTNNIAYNSSTGLPFTLSAGEWIVIEGIPVGTKYQVTETVNGTPTYVLNESESINIGAATPEEITGDTTAIVYNSRQTGMLNINKYVYNEAGTVDVSSGCDTVLFPVTLELTAPANVNLGNYSVIARSNGNVLAGELITRTVSGNNLTLVMKINPTETKHIEVSGLPYGTTYTVTEGDVPVGYAKLDRSSSPTTNYYVDTGNTNVEYNTSTTHTIGSTAGNVKVFNKLEPIIMPSTGGSGVIFIFPLGILAVVLSGAAFVIYKRRSGQVPAHAAKGRYQRRR